MKDHLITCPLCNYDIPFDSSKCSYCGALLAPGPSRNVPILKGIVCSNCGSRNYNYDSCDSCGHRFTKSCINCGADIALKATECPECGFAGRRVAAGQRRESASDVEPPRSTLMTYSIPIGVAVVIALAAIIYAMWPSAKPPGAPSEPGPRPGEARAVDTDGDGSPDYWDVYGENEIVVERRHDQNHDGIIEKVEFFDAEGNPKFAHVDADGDGQAEQIHTFTAKGVLSMVYHYEGSTFDVPRRLERYNAEGNLVERWIDRNSDGSWDKYQRYNARGNLVVEGTDTQETGIIDRYFVFRGNREIFQRMYDGEGDGIIEKIETLNSQGIRIIMEEDTDGSGRIDKKTFFHLTGKTRWVQLDTNGDGVHDTFKSYTKEGRLARTGVDVDADGKPDTWK
ncbi:MAG: hypothetical protein P9L99_03300 [Candidatus Lernaella stagnicola]|nr:hypothetical protein [Candidatus Lernaella stagnicola]